MAEGRLARKGDRAETSRMAHVEDDPDLVEARPRMRFSLGRLVRAGIDLVLPPLCPGCGARVADPSSLCPSCWADLPAISRPFCERTAIPFEIDPGPGTVAPEAIQRPPVWDRARAAVRYDGIAPKLVQALKYGDRHEVAPLMAGLMARAGADILREADLVVPVPLHRRRLWSRRFNQAALLARGAASLAHRPCRLDVIVRRKATPSQVGLSEEARARNMAGAFAVPVRLKPLIAGRRVVLVDDVLTSGATLSAAARVLKRAGAGAVDVLVFARVGDVLAP